MLSSVRVGIRLGAAFAGLCLAIILVGALGLSSNATLAENTALFFRHPFTVGVTLTEAKAEIYAMSRAVGDVVMATDETRQSAAIADIDRREQTVLDDLRIMRERYRGDESDIVALANAFSDWKPIRDELIRLARDGKRNEATDVMRGKGAAQIVTIGDAMAKVLGVAKKKAEGFMENAEAMRARILWISIFVIGLSILFGAALSLVIARSITRPLFELRAAMSALAANRLGVDVPHCERGDEIGEMARALAVFKQDAVETAELTKQVADSSHQAAVATNQATSAVGQVSEGAHAQLGALRRVSSALQQSKLAIGEVSRSTQGARELSRDVAERVRGGGALMREMMAVVKGTADQAKRIEKMAESIWRIADQTHMLALNAAIEAARAGDHGKGFAVVADEVRKLAEHSGDLAQEIGELVRSATDDTQRAVAMVDDVNGRMDQISESVRRNDTLTAAVAASMEEQQVTVTEIGDSIEGLTQIAQSNATASEEITATMVDLSRLAEQLRVQICNHRQRIHAECVPGCASPAPGGAPESCASCSQ